MARPNGPLSMNSGLRKRLIQPALPALPLIAKARKEKESLDVKKEGEIVVNGDVTTEQAAASAAAEPEVEPHSITPMVEEDIHPHEATSPVSPSLTAVTLDGTQANDINTDLQEIPLSQTELDVSVPLPSQDGISTEGEDAMKHAITDVAEIPDAHTLPEQPVDSADGDTLSDGWEPPSIAYPSITQSLAGRVSWQEGTKEPKPVNGGHTTDLAPEAVTGYVEASLLPHHAAQASISNSSIQHTPKNGIAVLASPQSIRTHRQQDSVHSRAEAAPEVLLNGYDTPDMRALYYDDLMRPATQSGFPTIIDHIRGVQFTQEWFDCDICVYYPNTSRTMVCRHSHSLVLLRSERMRSFIYPQRANNYSYYVVNLYPARSINVNAFDAALRFLYADTVLHADRLFSTEMLQTKSGKVSALDYVVSYLVAGLELGLEPVVTRSLDLVGRYLDWDIAELAMREAILLRQSLTLAVNPNSPPQTYFASNSILEHVFNLFVLTLNIENFKLDTIANCNEMVSRLADFDGRAAVNPALANMVFGSMPSSSGRSSSLADESPAKSATVPDTAASVIMLNMEFEDLRGLTAALKRAHGDSGIQIITEVIEERERRRFNVVNNRSVSNKHRMAHSNIWEVLAWREYVLDGNLERERVGFTLSNKRGGHN
ncbi:hypothetical protein R6Q59_009926 [Mikania micrantha]